MVRIAYAHDGVNVYDMFFLRHLSRKNNVLLLTFNVSPSFVPCDVRILKMKEPLARVTAGIRFTEGLRMYVLWPLRAILFQFYLYMLKPDIVIGCMATKYGFYSVLSRFHPVLLIVWGSDVLIAPKRFFLLRFMAKYALKKSDAVIVDSEVQRDAVVELGCNPNKILKFPWFDLDRTKSITRKRDLVRRKLGWVGNPIVVCVRMHEPIYGVEYLLEAIPYVIKAVPESRFLLIGEGRLSTQFKKRVKEMRIGPHVKFMGRLSREETIMHMSAADVYVSTSLSDGTSASLLEAMALRLPPVVTEIPGNKEWVLHGWNGLLVPVKDSRSVADGIISLLKGKALREKIGRRALEVVKAKTGWEENSKRLDFLINELITASRSECAGKN